MRVSGFAVLVVALFILGVMVSIPSANAATIIWNGSAGDGKWETAGNWVGGVVPGAADDANIPNDAFVVTISTSQTVDTLIVGSGDTVICESTCSLSANSRLTNVGTFTNFGSIFQGNGACRLDNVGTFTNFGSIDQGGGSCLLDNGGTFRNFGSIDSGGGGCSLINSGTFENSGSIDLGGGGCTLVNLVDFTNSGTITFGGSPGFGNDGNFIDKCHGTVAINPTSGTGTFTTDPTCPVVGGEVLSLNYESLMFSALSWIVIIAGMAAAAVIALSQKIKRF